VHLSTFCVQHKIEQRNTKYHMQVGCGADELIDLLLRCVLDPGDAIIDCQPTFGMYAFDTDVSAGRVIMIPRRRDFSLDMEAILDAIKEQKPKVVFLTSPNNPDGSMLPEADLLKLLAQPVRTNTLSFPCLRVELPTARTAHFTVIVRVPM
jgi:histidinol-phosphate/aromatic aminotransferase/cobyric acid decarboxylase-like protein